MSDRDPSNSDADTRMWGGRFEGASDPLFQEFNDSLPFDRVLARYDIDGSIAWAVAIRDAGVLTKDECNQITGALCKINTAVKADAALFDGATDEDIHGWVERELIERVGDLGKKLHTGRSRNDQVATDFRLYARAEAHRRIEEMTVLMKGLVDLAARETDTILPGYTHLQRAQPVLFAHWCLAYFEMLDRDRARLADALGRINVCPLGSAALAGSSFPVDRDALARSLGFDRASANSLDAVSDRDFVVEMLSTAALCGVHLSRLAEDLIIYNSAEFGFVEMSDAVTSGSSLMPQKKNPDAMELMRGKTGRLCGELITMLVTLKGTSLAYNKDLQEDKLPLFSAMRELSMCLRMAERVLIGLTTRPDVTRQAAQGGHSNATAFANHLVEQGTPFREAHDQTGQVVRLALEKGCAIEQLSIDELRSIAPAVCDSVFDEITLDAVIRGCDVLGGTNPDRVRRAIEVARQRILG